MAAEEEEMVYEDATTVRQHFNSVCILGSIPADSRFTIEDLGEDRGFRDNGNRLSRVPLLLASAVV